MRPTSLEPVFLPVTADVAPLKARMKRARQSDDMLRMLEEAPFDTEIGRAHV